MNFFFKKLLFCFKSNIVHTSYFLNLFFAQITFLHVCYKKAYYYSGLSNLALSVSDILFIYQIFFDTLIILATFAKFLCKYWKNFKKWFPKNLAFLPNNLIYAKSKRQL